MIPSPSHSPRAGSAPSPWRQSAQAVCLALAALAGAGPLTAHAQDAAALPEGASSREFQVPAGPLDAALGRFARTAEVNLAYEPTLLDGLRSPGLNGRYGIADALSRLLAGTGIQAVPEPGGGYSLRKAQTKGADGAALPTVTVTGAAYRDGASELPAAYTGGQVARGARLGVLGNVDVMDAPFNVTAYTAQTITDQQSATVGDVLRNDPSVRYTTPDGHNAENYTIRGFEVNSTELAFNGMYGLLPGAHVPTEFLERVEVFKGPAAMLSGIAPSGAVGGVINLVPKRAGSEPLTRVTASYASESRLGAAADVGRRFGPEQRLGVRINGSLSDGKTSLEDQKKHERFAALGLDYQGEHWKLELDAYTARQNQSNGSPLMVGFSTLGHVVGAPDTSKNALRGTFADQETDGVSARGQIDINSQWTAWASLGGARYHYDGYLNGTRVVMLNDKGDARGQTYNQAGYTHSAAAETGLRGRFSTGAVAHQVVMSASALKTRTGLASAVTSSSYTTNIYNPLSTPTLAGPHGAEVKNADNTFTSFSLSDTLSMHDDAVQLTLGARAQRVRQSMASPRAYDESAVTPLLGLAVKPWGPALTLYANYIEGLSPGVAVGTTYANSGDTLAPYKTKQIEVGTKWDAGGFTNTLSLFRIQKPSTISVASGAALPTLALDGEQRNTGLEWNVFGEVLPHVRALGGVVYIDGKQVRASTAANDGKVAPGVPKWTANLGTEWDTPWLRALTLSARMTFTSAQYLDAANTLEIPSWTRWDLGARYATRIGGKAVAFRASVENAANKNYWAGRFNDGFATLGGTRVFKLSTSVDF